MKKIKTALLAYGASGKVFHAPFITFHPGFEMLGAWERSNKKIQLDYPNAKSYSSLDEVLKDDLDLVIINTPIDTHFDFAKKALDAGKHILVEKAFTTTVSEAEILRDTAKGYGLTVTVYQNRRWDSDFKTVKSILDQGVLGDIVEAEIRFDRYSPALSPKAWKEIQNPGSGILLDLGSHIIDQALHLFGMPNAVFADIRKLREGSLIDDNIDILLYYPQLRVRLHAGLFNKEQLPGYVLQGKNGSFIKPRGDVQEDVLKTGTRPNLTDWGTEPTNLSGILHTVNDNQAERRNVETLQGNYYEIFEGVYQSIVHGKPEIVSAQDGVNNMRIIETAKRSSEEKTVIELN